MNPAENTVIGSPKLSTRRTRGATILRDLIVRAVPRMFRHKKSGSFFANAKSKSGRRVWLAIHRMEIGSSAGFSSPLTFV
jgi:hypothetical protein